MKLYAVGIVVLSMISCAPEKPNYDLSPNAPPDRPGISTASEMAVDASALKPLIEQARATYPAAKQRFLKGLPPKQVFFVRVELFDSKGRQEGVYVHVLSIDDGMISGTVANYILLVQGYRMNQKIKVREADVEDWYIAYPDGSEEGNLIGKYYREKQGRN